MFDFEIDKNSSLVENIVKKAQKNGDKIFSKMILNKKGEFLEISFRKLLKESSKFANLYLNNNVKRSDTVIIILKHSPGLLYSFIGALLIGAIPSIFSHPSKKVPYEIYLKQLPQLIEYSKSLTMVTYEELGDKLVDIKDLKTIYANKASNFSEKFELSLKFDLDEIAFLQHSSGTTGLKKGVALSSRAVLNQIINYAPTIELNSEDRIVSWLPLYHDMGLIACFILPALTGVKVTMMSPFDWVEKPVMLLKAINEDRGTLSWLPNFSYQFLAERVSKDEISDLDLSSMRAFINCAEPITKRAHDRFYEAFKNIGVTKKMFSTCYGMAENTFAVTQSKIGYLSEVESSKRKYISSGSAIPNTLIKVIDEDGKEASDGVSGEIILKSDCRLTEYYNRKEETEKAIKGDFYFTGDIGFVMEKELYIVGRKKDMLIVSGKNIYPQDIEESVSEIDVVIPGRVAAIGKYNDEIGTQEIIVLAEVLIEDFNDQKKVFDIKINISKQIKEDFDCVAKEIFLLPHMFLVKSSSGKISRSLSYEKVKNEYT